MLTIQKCVFSIKPRVPSDQALDQKSLNHRRKVVLFKRTANFYCWGRLNKKKKKKKNQIIFCKEKKKIFQLCNEKAIEYSFVSTWIVASTPITFSPQIVFALHPAPHQTTPSIWEFYSRSIVWVQSGGSLTSMLFKRRLDVPYALGSNVENKKGKARDWDVEREGGGGEKWVKRVRG